MNDLGKSTMELFHKYVSFLIQEIKIKMINFLKIGDLATLWYNEKS